MTKQVATTAQLEHYIREEMQQHRCCAGQIYPAVYPLREDEDGHNWDVDILPGFPSDLPRCEECDNAVQGLVQTLRGQYMLVDNC